jgi:hypothetical protein
MMNKKIQNTLLCGIMILSLNACKKDNSDDSGSNPSAETANASKIQLLTEGSIKSWRRTLFETQDGIYTPDSCTLDDRLNLHKDGTLTRTFGTEVCNPNETTVNGTWMLSANGNMITFNATVNGNMVVQTMELVELTQEKMKVYYISSGDSITGTYGHP